MAAAPKEKYLAAKELYSDAKAGVNALGEQFPDITVT